MGQLRIGICDDEEMILKTLYGLVEQAVRKTGLEFEILVFLLGRIYCSRQKNWKLLFLILKCRK